MALNRLVRLPLIALLGGTGVCAPIDGERGAPGAVEARLDRGAPDFGTVVVRAVDPERPPCVEVRAGDDPDAPPLAGRLVAAGDSVRFVPRYPLGDIGAIRVRVDGAEHRFAVVAPPVPAPAAVVAAVHPAAPAVPENQLRWYVEFSAPMREGEAARHVRLVDAAGREVQGAFLSVEEELWDPARRRLTLLFDMGRVKRGIRTHEEAGSPLEAGRGYAIVIDSAWRDARGAPLVRGAVHRFRAVAADLRGPDPRAWRISSPAAGGTDPLDVALDGTVDHAMGLQMVSVWRADVPIAGTVRLSADDRRWHFTPTHPWVEGSYELRVGGALEDAAGNSVSRAFEVPADARIEQADGRWVTRSFGVRPSR